MNNLPQSNSALIAELRETVSQLKAENLELKNEVEQLRLQLLKKKSKPPFHPKTNVNQEEVTASKPKRRKLRVKAYTRKRSIPTHQVLHAVSCCNECGVSISGKSVAYTREIIDIPIVKPTITEHVVIKRSCWNCGHTTIPEVDLSLLVVGRSRMGVNLVSHIVTLKERFRLPIRMIKQYLKVFCQLDLSTGEIVSLLHKTAKTGQPHYQQLQTRLRSSDTVHGDETGWRENGINKYIWGFNTPTIRYFVYQRSRGSQVVQEVLGSEFEGVLVSDFYAAYNIHDGQHQRCWAHLLRDLKDLTKWFPDRQEIKDIYDRIQSSFKEAKILQASNLSLPKRHQHRRQLESNLLKLVNPYLKQKDHPFHTLAKRIDKFLDELFVFVLDENIPATNNSAERALRHSVITRKISGGTRSSQGSRSKEVLSSLFGTWDVRGLNPLDECRQLLTNPNYSI